MLKLMQGHKFFTVFLLSAITIMISVAFIFWGIGPKDNAAVSYVAEIDDEKITLDSYWRAYDNELKRQKDQDKSTEEIEKMNLEDRVLMTMVDRAVLLIAAREAGIGVTEKELQETIVKIPAFQRDGVFDPNIYKRFLKLRRMSPQSLEASIQDDMIINRMTKLIGETAELTSDELKIIESMEEQNKNQLKEIFRSSKTSQTIQAYIESVKRKMDITINRDLIS